MLELLEEYHSSIDFNSPDNEGNTPLHFASQAGHIEVVSYLLNKVRTIQVDPINNLGFTPLMKSALQGRVKCSKLLLFSGKKGFSKYQTIKTFNHKSARHETNVNYDHQVEQKKVFNEIINLFYPNSMVKP